LRFLDGIRFAVFGEVGFSVKGAVGESVNFDLVASEVVPGESHNPAVATSTDSTTFHVHIAPEVAQNYTTHMKFKYGLQSSAFLSPTFHRLPDCKGFVPIRMTCLSRVNSGVLEVRAQLDVAPVSVLLSSLRLSVQFCLHGFSPYSFVIIW
jgi:hypothetical protein